MAKNDNTIWWVIGVIAVLVLVVGGGFGIFGTEKAKCQRDGGIYVESSFGNYCNFPTTDAGVRCDDSSQCQGFCEQDSIQCVTTPCLQGKCSSTTTSSGCIDILQNGQEETICID